LTIFFKEKCCKKSRTLWKSCFSPLVVVVVVVVVCIRDEPAVACEPSGDHGAENEVDRAEERVPPGANQPGNFRWASFFLMIFQL
jgi:hypothetical protein